MASYNSTDEMFEAEDGDCPEARSFTEGNGYFYSPNGSRLEEDWLGQWAQDEDYEVPAGYCRTADGSGWFPPGHPAFD